jgi:hypothetical protein
LDIGKVNEIYKTVIAEGYEGLSVKVVSVVGVFCCVGEHIISELTKLLPKTKT